jgi:hypothetical protein
VLCIGLEDDGARLVWALGTDTGDDDRVGVGSWWIGLGGGMVIAVTVVDRVVGETGGGATGAGDSLLATDGDGGSGGGCDSGCGCG